MDDEDMVGRWCSRMGIEASSTVCCAKLLPLAGESWAVEFEALLCGSFMAFSNPGSVKRNTTRHGGFAPVP